MPVLNHHRLSSIGELIVAGDTVAANQAIADVFADLDVECRRQAAAEEARVAAYRATMERLAAEKEKRELARHRAAVCTSCFLEHAGECL